MNCNQLIFGSIPCQIKEHQGSPIIGLCIDNQCDNKNKLTCLECIFSVHSQHKLVKLAEIEQKILENLEKEKNSNIDNSESGKIYKIRKEKEEFLHKSIDSLKTYLIENIETKTKDFLHSTQNKIIQIEQKYDDNLSLKILIKKLGTPKTLKQYEYFSLSISNFYKKMIENSALKSNEINKEKTILKEFEDFEKNIKTFISEQKSLISTFLQTKYLVSKSNSNFEIKARFQWSDKSYGNYGFLYTLSNDNQTLTKTSTDGTITIIRGKDELAQGLSYYIEYLINSPQCGDFDVGFGKDNVGYTCWLRSTGGYGITNMGIYINGTLVDKTKRIKDKDLVGMNIKLKNNASECEFFINKKKVYSFTFETTEIFPMCAIRKINNSVTVTSFKILKDN